MADNIILTGDKELDKKLAALPDKMQKKHIKKATRAAAKKVLKRARAITPKDTGAMVVAMAVRATSRNITRKMTVKSSKGGTRRTKKTVAKEFGAKVTIDRKSLDKQTAKRGKKRSEDQDRKEDYFYPALVELGGDGKGPKMPLRAGLKAAEGEAMGEFKTELRKLVANP